MLVAVVLAAAPLARSLGAPVGVDCLVQQADLPDEGCCGDPSSSPLCSEACATGGSACMAPAIRGAGPQIHFDAPAAMALSPSATQVRAPDTAPPKSDFA